MTRYPSANSGTVVRTFCAVCAVLALAGMSRVVFSQSAGVALPASQSVGQLAGTVGSKRASLIAKIAPNLKAGLTAQEAAEILGSADQLEGWDRARAIQSIERTKKLGPLGADAAMMLRGTNASSRAASVADIAPYLKTGLTAREAAAILGTVEELKGWDRARAIQSIARAKKLGPLDAEVSQMLQGTTESSRAAGVADLAPYLKADLTAQQAATMLGSTDELEGWDRARAIQSIARTKKLAPLGPEGALLLKGTNGSSRTAAIADLASYLETGLTAAQAAAILASTDELAGWDRARAIRSIAHAGKVRAGFSEVELAPVLDGTTGSARASSLEALRAAKPGLAGTTAGSTPSVVPGTPSTSLPTIGSTDGSLPPSNPAPGRARIVASVLGETATDGGTISPRVPVGVGIEVSFRAFVGEDTAKLGLGRPSQPLPTSVNQGYRYAWYVDDKLRSEGERFVQWFGGGAYAVEVRAEPIALTAQSTPQVIGARLEELRAWVRVLIVEKPEWNCRGRLGARCADRGRSNLTSDVKVEPGCGSRASTVCIASKMSVGAIKHDYCCSRFPEGHMCEGIKREISTQLDGAVNFDVLPGKTICEAEWEQAEADRLNGDWWDFTWEYPPRDGSESYALTSRQAGWYRHLAPSGTKVSSVADGIFCKSGGVQEKKVVNAAMAGNPYLLSSMNVWVCK